MQELSLQCPPELSDTGAYRISWNGPEDALFRLEENGELLYEGPELATTVSGRTPSDYVYRVGLVESPTGTVGSWSSRCSVTVSPPPLSLALGFFSVGFVVFVALLVVVIRGHRAHRRGEIG